MTDPSQGPIAPMSDTLDDDGSFSDPSFLLHHTQYSSSSSHMSLSPKSNESASQQTIQNYRVNIAGNASEIAMNTDRNFALKTRPEAKHLISNSASILPGPTINDLAEGSPYPSTAPIIATERGHVQAAQHARALQYGKTNCYFFFFFFLFFQAKKQVLKR